MDHWIPACAGMTGELFVIVGGGVVDPRMRGDDATPVISKPGHQTGSDWILVCAAMTIRKRLRHSFSLLTCHFHVSLPTSHFSSPITLP
jgi:hypothetical protein